MLYFPLLIQFKVNLIMEEAQARKRKCERCNRRILLSRFDLHLAKCKPREPKPTKKEAREIRRREEEAAREIRENSPPPETQEKIPCNNCGYQQTLSELDTHPLICPHREVTCSACLQKYPLSIFHNHRDLCPRRAEREQRPAPQAPTSNDAVFRYPPGPRVRILDRPNDPPTSLNIPNSRPENPRNQANRSQTIPSVLSRTQQETVVPSSLGTSEPSNSRNEPPPNRTQISFYVPFSDNRSSIFTTQSDSSRPNIFQSRPAVGSTSNGVQRSQQYVQRVRISNHAAVIERQAMRHRVMEEMGRLMAAQELASRSTAQLARQLAARHQTKPEQGLSKSLIKLIPERKFQSREDGEEELCAICCTEFEKQDYVKDLKCKHDFHVKCLTDWLCINSSCPLCKCNLAANIKENEKERSKSKPKKENKPLPASLMTFQAFMARQNWDSDDTDQ